MIIALAMLCGMVSLSTSAHQVDDGIESAAVISRDGREIQVASDPMSAAPIAAVAMPILALKKIKLLKLKKLALLNFLKKKVFKELIY